MIVGFFEIFIDALYDKHESMNQKDYLMPELF